MKNKNILIIGAIVLILILSTTSSVNSYSNKNSNDCEYINLKNLKIIENTIEGHGTGHEPSEMDLTHLTGKKDSHYSRSFTERKKARLSSTCSDLKN